MALAGQSAEGKEYTLDTSTTDGALREAALTIDAKDMLPVSGRFEFADSEWVEIATVPETVEAPVATAVPPANLPVPVAVEPPVVTRPALSAIELAERELEVRAAIDRLNGGAGQPIGIETESGNIVVTVYNLAPQQEGQLRAGLGSMEGVIIRSADRGSDSGPDAFPACQAPGAAPFPAIDTSEAIVVAGAPVEQLAARFRPEMEAKLTDNGRVSCTRCGAPPGRDEAGYRHADVAIGRHSAVVGTRRPLARIPKGPPSFGGALTEAARSVHRLVTSVYAGRVRWMRHPSWPELAAKFARLRRLELQTNRRCWRRH